MNDGAYLWGGPAVTVAAMSTPTNTDTAATSSALPLAPGRWQVDTNHSSVSFSIRHLGLAKVRGRFNVFEAWIEVGESLTDSRLEATVDMASIDTGNTDRDAHVRSPEFLDVEAHPTMHFVSTEITGSDDSWLAHGTATLKGVSRPFSLDVEFGGLGAFMDDTHAGFSASGQLRRKDFELSFDVPGGNTLLGDVVGFDLDVEFVAPKD
jgi:polyisoprenoid-binding protein YceI